MSATSWVGPEVGTGPPAPGKSHVAIGFLRNPGVDPLREAIGPLGSNPELLFKGGPVWPSVKYIDGFEKKMLPGPPTD